MPDEVMECPKCHGTADVFAGSDRGVHYRCRSCGCAFVFDLQTLKVTVDEDGDAPDPVVQR